MLPYWQAGFRFRSPDPLQLFSATKGLSVFAKIKMEVLTAKGPKEVAFSPYQDNGGFVFRNNWSQLCELFLFYCVPDLGCRCRTALAVAGKDFVVIASDTRISTGYSIHTRDGSKITQLYVYLRLFPRAGVPSVACASRPANSASQIFARTSGSQIQLFPSVSLSPYYLARGRVLIFFKYHSVSWPCSLTFASLVLLLRTDKSVIASSGMQADIKTLFKVLEMRMKAFKHQHRRQMPTPAIAQMLGNTLYYKRFFPYYTFNIFAGLNEQGEGCVYSYDAVGSFQRVPVSCTGSGHELIQPLLDNQIDRAHQQGLGHWDLSQLEAVELVKDAFSSACERDIYTGDHVDIAVINKDGVHWDKFDLKFD